MDNISYASEEQSKGVEQVGVAVTQMDQVTQQNAARGGGGDTAVGVEEQAALLAQAVADIQTGGGGTAPGRRGGAGIGGRCRFITPPHCI